METDTTQKNIQESVTRAIKSGKVTMRSPLHFLFKTIVLIGALLGVLILSTVILNFILFSIYIQSHHELLGFGIFGMLAFITAFPWPLFFIDVALVVAIVYLLRSFRIGYKTPVLYLSGALLLMVGVLGILTEQKGASMNVRIMHRVEEGQLPTPLPHLFEGTRTLPPHKRPMCRCEILEIREEGFLVAKDTRSGATLMFVLKTPSLYATTTGLMVGDVVFIAGAFDGDGDEDDVIEAFGIKRAQR